MAEENLDYSLLNDSPLLDSDSIMNQIPEEEKYVFRNPGGLRKQIQLFGEEGVAKFLSQQYGLSYDALTTPRFDDVRKVSTKPYTNRDIINMFTAGMRDVSLTDYMGEEFVKGLVKGVPAAPGAKYGLRAGVAIGSRFNPIYGTLFGGGLGMVLGGGLGFKAGEEFIEKPFLTKEGEVPVEYMGFGRAAEFTGETIPFIFNTVLSPYKGLPPSVVDYLDNLAVQGGKKLQKFFAAPIKFVDRLGLKAVKTSKLKPVPFYGIELSTTLGAAGGAGYIEDQFKTDNPWVQSTGELVGGKVGSPVVIFQNAKNVLSSLFQKFTKEGRLTTIGKKIIKRLQEQGELVDPGSLTDPDRRAAAQLEFDTQLNKLIETLDAGESDFDQLVRDMGLPVLKRPSAIQADSSALMALHNKYASRKDSDGSIDLSRKNYADGLVKMFEIFSRIDDPAALSKAAQLREIIIRNAVMNAISDETAEGVRIADNFLKKGTDAEGNLVDPTSKGMAAGNIIYTKLLNLKKELRQLESSYYNKIDAKQELEITPLKETVLKVLGDYSIDERSKMFDLWTRNFMKKVVGEDVISVKDTYQKKLKPITTKLNNLNDRYDSLSVRFPDSKDAFESLFNYFNKADVEEQISFLQNFKRNLETGKLNLTQIFDRVTRTVDEKGRVSIQGFDPLTNAQRNKITLFIDNQLEKLRLKKVESGILGEESQALAALESAREGEDILSFATVGDLRTFKRNMYNSMMNTPKDRPADRGTYSTLHSAVYDVFGTKVKELKELSDLQKLDDNQRNLLNAFSFSKGFNDAFTRKYVGDILYDYDKDGFRGASSPELLADQLFRKSPIENRLRVGQIKNAINFYKDQLPEDIKLSDSVSDTVQGQLEIILRYLVERANIIDPKVLNQIKNKNIDLEAKNLNLINEEKLATFLKEKGSEIEVLSPALFADLQDLKKANLLLKNILTKKNPFAEASSNILAFSKFIGVESNPGNVLRSAIGTPDLRTDNALKNLNGIAKSVKDSSDAVKKGFTQVALQDAYSYAFQVNDEKFNFAKFKNYLLKPLEKGKEKGQSLLSVMKNNDIISEQQYISLNLLLNEFEKIEKFDKAGKIADIADLPSALTTMYFSIAGSKIGRKAADFIPFLRDSRSTGLIEAGEGAKFGRSIGIDLPQTYFTNFVEQVIKEPRQMARVLKKAKNAREWFGIHKQFNAYLDSIGLSAVGETEAAENLLDLITPSIEQETPPPPLPIGVPDKAVQAPIAPQQVAMATPLPPAPKPDMASRARFQQLFPMDIASQTMTQTAPPMKSGIGSLV